MQNTVRINYTEADKLTYTEWEAIHKAIKEEEKQERKAERKSLIVQKFFGGVLVFLSILFPILLQEATASLFLFPLGIAVMVTKEKVVG